MNKNSYKPKNDERARFIEALEQQSLELLYTVGKSDLHNHAGRGGNKIDVEAYAGVKIDPPSRPFSSLDEMNDWLRVNIKPHCPPGMENYLFRVKAAFKQASRDSVRVLALDFAVDEVRSLGGAEAFVRQMDAFHCQYAPNTILLPDLTIYAMVDESYLQELFASGWFHAIDIINYYDVLSMSDMKRISRLAKQNGLLVKAHIGEFGTADQVLRYAEELELDEIQHGVLAARSKMIMQRLANARIRLNVCPTSNVMLGVCEDYRSHPIRELYDNGVLVTVNTDDLLIFNASVSDEYMNLYRSGLMTPCELADIWQNGLSMA